MEYFSQHINNYTWEQFKKLFNNSRGYVEMRSMVFYFPYLTFHCIHCVLPFRLSCCFVISWWFLVTSWWREVEKGSSLWCSIQTQAFSQNFSVLWWIMCLLTKMMKIRAWVCSAFFHNRHRKNEKVEFSDQFVEMFSEVKFLLYFWKVSALKFLI